MSQLPIFFASLLLAFIPCSTSLTSTFNFPSFPNDQNIKLFGDAFVNAERNIDLTITDRSKSMTSSTGWAVYANPVTLYDARAGFTADFQSSFSFVILSLGANCTGDGMAFFMAPVNWTHNAGNSGAGLGIFNKSSGADNRQIIAVEFDTFRNEGIDPLTGSHMGIDIASINSSAYAELEFDVVTNTSFNSTAFINYNSATGNLSSYVKTRNYLLEWYTSVKVNLTTVLPETVILGFSASTGDCSEGHRIVSWNFSITAPNQTPTPTPAPGPIPKMAVTNMQNKAVIILVACLVPLIMVVVVIIIIFVRKRKNKKVELKEEEEEEEEEADDFADMTMNFETGPRKFKYGELATATNDFNEGGKLGQGGFGGVYRGTLGDTMEVVAVKRFSKGSSQGKKEYAAEVTVISRLRHRNLVRLIGWCHERGEFLLVYEYMEGGSLDSHLFSSKGCPVLPWAQRRKVALGLASAVLYLHDEWEQCVVHRDIKLSNVMVDSEFNARLGDFGLARLTNHGFAARTTMVAGTVGYLAPECVITGKFSTQSDVYSFGVVLLEIATGRRAIRPIGEKVARLVEWIWDFYGVGSLLSAADERLESEFDQQEMERMMVVGLWCVHPDPERRPTIREAIKALSLQAEVPNLPQKMPMPFYAPPPMNGLSSLFTSNSSGTTATTTSTSTTVSSTESAEVALLRSQG